MKTFGAAIAAATFFSNVALAAVDPIVIKVRFTRPKQSSILTIDRVRNSSINQMAHNSS